VTTKAFDLRRQGRLSALDLAQLHAVRLRRDATLDR
jgi:hypothetical protein